MSQTQANALLQQSEANLALGFQGQDEGCHSRDGAWREATASRVRTQQWQQCRHRTSASNDATAGIFWAWLSSEPPPTLSPPRQEALYMQLSPEEDPSQSSPGTAREGGSSELTPPRKTGIWVFQIPAPQ